MSSYTTLKLINGTNNYGAFCVKKAAAQSIAHNTTTQLTYDTEQVDINNVFASNAYTPQESGKYRIMILLADVEGTSPNNQINGPTGYIYKNGVQVSQVALNDNRNNYRYNDNCFTDAIIEMNGTSDSITFYANVYTLSPFPNCNVKSFAAGYKIAE